MAAADQVKQSIAQKVAVQQPPPERKHRKMLEDINKEVEVKKRF